ncbi:MAG: thymidine kinase [Oscillibacter sp.]|nr:thymidine kinase [Oscillibacter sp.]
MAQLYFKYGVMGSSKTANALMTRFNYEERGQKALLVKPRLDARDGDHVVRSRIGLEYPCIYFDELRSLSVMELQQNACVIVDEAQFLTAEEVDYLASLVDDLGIPVICYGLRADFKGDLFPGSGRLLVMADKLEEIKTVCWCGKKAIFNARFTKDGVVLKEGAQVVLGTNEQYIGLCRRHWRAGDLGPDFFRNREKPL